MLDRSSAPHRHPNRSSSLKSPHMWLGPTKAMSHSSPRGSSTPVEASTILTSLPFTAAPSDVVERAVGGSSRVHIVVIMFSERP